MPFDALRINGNEVRGLVPLPLGMNSKTVGAIPGELARAGIICDSDRLEKSRRPEAHARKITVWRLIDQRAALVWLDEYPELLDSGHDDGEEPPAHRAGSPRRPPHRRVRPPRLSLPSSELRLIVEIPLPAIGPSRKVD